jgi:hypothetical protein
MYKAARQEIGRDEKGGGLQGSMWQQLVALEAAAAAEVLDGVQVVAATCVGAGETGPRADLGYGHGDWWVFWVHVKGCMPC